MSSPALLVLAAGMSSRYGGVSKQTDAMGPAGETLLDYSVHDAKRAGFGRVVFIIRREGEAAFRERVVSRLEPHLRVDLVYQDLTDLPDGFACPGDRAKPWGTGHAVLAARHEVTEPFCVINADDFYGRDAFTRVGDFLRRGQDGTALRLCMAGYELRNTMSEFGKVARGLCTVADGRLEKVEELTDIWKTESGAENRPEGGPLLPLTGREVVSLNMWGFQPGLFALLEREFTAFLRTSAANPKAEFYIPFAVDNLVRSGEATVDVLPTSSRWFGVTYQQDKPRVQSELQALVTAGEYPSPLWHG